MAASPALKPALKTGPQPATTKPKLGLRAWMERVLVECDRAADGFDADPVHDLRVALRRCRSLADGLMAIDPDPSWKEMKKAGKKLFQALGGLRDMQVMEEWIEKLGDGSQPRDPVSDRLLEHLHRREAEGKQEAFKALQQFDRKQWRQWGRSLPRRAARVRPGSVVYMHLALEKWSAAYELHKHALRTRSQVSWHELRIGIKRFRYTVENFLPRQHALWGDDLKELQDLLGEVHDFDVLWATAVEIMAFPDVESRRRWREKLNVERMRRIARYREKMVGRQSLWQVWRAALPAGPQLRAAALSRLRVWARYIDPDYAHSQRVAQLSLVLYDGLKNAGLLKASVAAQNGLTVASQSGRARSSASPVAGSSRGPSLRGPSLIPFSLTGGEDWRGILQAAALMHDVGKAKGSENHSKASYRMIRKLPRPLGLSARELELAAVVARYHRGALPRPQRKTLQMLELPLRRVAMELAGILRLANALDARRRPSLNETENAPRLEISAQDGAVMVRMTGYSALDRSAEEIAAARHLLETVLRQPVLVRALRTPTAGAKSEGRVVVEEN
ncbi:MAG TPA: CHAD domain-containing protein [Terriglobales bacterium]|nr:CHAD domain-containing protein [Terriglobales bacterium]